ncbi:MAG: hydroxylase, partial [Gammaproteobacteria bacterium]
FPEQAQREVFTERPFGLIPIQPSPSVTIKKVSGGYEISGRSNFSSGIMHADWVVIAKAGGEDARALVVPIEDVEVDDVWHMSGMSATGSNDIITEDLFVPEHRTLPAVDLFEASPSIHDNPLYTMPLLPFIYCEVIGVYCGGLEGATAAYENLMQNKVKAWGGDVLATKQAVHIKLGEAHARARAAGHLLERLVADTQIITEQGNFTLDTRLDLKLRAGFIADLCREGMNAMMARAGTRSFRKDAPLQRFFRDLNTIATHAFLDWETCSELFGRHRLGLEPNHPLF